VVDVDLRKISSRLEQGTSLLPQPYDNHIFDIMCMRVISFKYGEC